MPGAGMNHVDARVLKGTANGGGRSVQSDQHDAGNQRGNGKG